MLTVSQLSKSFAGRALFDDVSLQVNRGDRIGLVGPQRPFSAYLKLEDGKVGFEFPEKTARAGESRQANIS
jgi:ABC-type hemin transport system ATPase subunit